MRCRAGRTAGEEMDEDVAGQLPPELVSRRLAPSVSSSICAPSACMIALRLIRQYNKMHERIRMHDHDRIGDRRKRRPTAARSRETAASPPFQREGQYGSPLPRRPQDRTGRIGMRADAPLTDAAIVDRLLIARGRRPFWRTPAVRLTERRLEGAVGSSRTFVVATLAMHARPLADVVSIRKTTTAIATGSDPNIQVIPACSRSLRLAHGDHSK